MPPAKQGPLAAAIARRRATRAAVTESKDETSTAAAELVARHDNGDEDVPSAEEAQLLIMLLARQKYEAMQEQQDRMKSQLAELEMLRGQLSEMAEAAAGPVLEETSSSSGE